MRVNYTGTQLTSLFLQSSLEDSIADYHRTLVNETVPFWDAIILTASNELQAEGYRKQIEIRKDRLPVKTDFIIVPDKDNKRVGSAGSTLSVIRELKRRYGSLEGKKFLCIHAGGNSSRCPQYSALGKLFSPVPMTLDNRPASLFDMFLVTTASLPSRMKDGMLLLSGDVTLLFNALMCDFGTCDAAVISFKENVQTGKNHGVYLKSDDGNVRKFLHKQTVEKLEAVGAVDERGNCSIDTGAIELSPKILEKLFSLVDTEEKYDMMVNDKVRLSLYGDIAYCLAEDSTLEEFYNEKPEGDYCPELTYARTVLWNAISCYNMKLLNLAPAKFVHFGSIPEILRLMNSGVAEYESLGWKKHICSSVYNDSVAGYNSILSEKAKVGEGTYLEVSYVHHNAKIGKNCLISFTDIHEESIPDNTVVHGLKQMNGKFVCRIFGTDDNPKMNSFFGKDIEKIAEKLGIDLSDIWNEGDSRTLWNAKIYPECGSIREAIAASLKVYELFVNGNGDITDWVKTDRKSLCSGFNDADPQAIIDWSSRMEELVRMDELAKLIKEGKPAKKATAVLNEKELTRVQEQWLESRFRHIDTSKLKDFSHAIRFYYYLGVALGNEKYFSLCFKTIADTILNSALLNLKYNENVRIAKDKVSVRLPLRVNWGGGWTDTAPYCIENGGTVLNAAIKLNGELPVEVKIEKINEKKIVFDSRDMDVHGEFTLIEPLQSTGDPYDSFALQKACLLACGIIPRNGGNLEEILTRMGGGFVMHSEVTDVPKGSGLGTSSILSAATVKAMLEFTGSECCEDVIYSTVLAMEQIMSTGGGWQDQIGGVTSGIKFITSEPAIDQKIKVDHIKISDETKAELEERFALIYTGQRRLARNLLRDVIGRYVGNEPDSIYAHEEIQKIAVLMRFALERGDIDQFAELMNEHWEMSKKIDSGSSNTLIEQILLSINDLTDAGMVCGAGGGGFLQVILKKGVSKQTVHERLKEVFQDFAVDVWSCSLMLD